MIFFKSILAGIIAAIAGATLWVLVAFVLPIVVPMLVSSLSANGGGGGGAVIDSGSILAAALVFFAVGFYWTFRRAKRRP